MLTQVGFWLASAPIGAGVWLWLAWANGRGYHWARPAFVAFFCVLTIVPFFGLGGAPLSYTWAAASPPPRPSLRRPAPLAPTSPAAARPYPQPRATTPTTPPPHRTPPP